VKLAVITLVHGRRAHLERQHAGVARGTERPDAYIVVAMDDPDLASWAPRDAVTPIVLPIAAASDRLPLARARNAGAEAALAADADLLVFLDVDCIPSPELLSTYRRAAEKRPDALLCGPVGYLPEGRHDPESFEGVAHFHNFRPRPEAGELQEGEHRLFWSLSFAVSASTWQRVGGFDERYEGYGAEDTDFAMRAERAGTPLVWVGGATAFHQHHPTSSPPVQHLDDILRNGELFSRLWGWWPMQGWLDQWLAAGIIEPADSSYRRVA
jgi:N-acetylglucosaminyl-diphospho-decaprenol L-rhamnosyltransferase